MSPEGFVNFIRQQVLKVIRHELRGFELATVVAPYPNLVVKVDNMKVELHKDDLIICERLSRNIRIVSLKSELGASRNLGDKTVTDNNSPMDTPYILLRFEEVLKPGDRVLVQAVPGGQKYIVVDRVVEYG